MVFLLSTVKGKYIIHKQNVHLELVIVTIVIASI